MRVPVNVGPVQHRAEHVRIGCGELFDRVPRRIAVRLIRADDEHHAGGLVRDDHAVRHDQDRRRVEHDPVEVILERTEEVDELRRARGARPGLAECGPRTSATDLEPSTSG